MDIFDEEHETWWLVSPSSHTKNFKLCLEKLSLYDKQRKIVSLKEDERKLAIPLNYEKFQDILKKDEELNSLIENFDVKIEHKYFPSQKGHRLKPKEKLCKAIRDLFIRKGIDFGEDLCQDLPSHWEKHGDLILFPDQCFQSEKWSHLGNELWTVTAETLGAKRLGKKSTIKDNDYRSPRVHLLVGTNGWVSHVDNEITYTYDVTKCMFSSGNITEKLRIGTFDCHGKTVVDLYAGIGYFVLPYLVHAGANTVYACEWNPHAVDALRRNLVINGVEKRCIVYEGDNRMFPHKGIADHVNLGLIPSSEAAWPVACAALHSQNGGWLHIHGNIASSRASARTEEDTTDQAKKLPSCNHKVNQEWKDWSYYVSKKITELLLEKNPSRASAWEVNVHHIEHVKSYAPRINHLVLDVKCIPLLDTQQRLCSTHGSLGSRC